MQPGDRVNWQYAPRGGYGYIVPVAAVVRGATASRAKIEVARKINGAWVRETKTVSRAKLTPRSVACEALGETD